MTIIITIIIVLLWFILVEMNIPVFTITFYPRRYFYSRAESRFSLQFAGNHTSNGTCINLTELQSRTPLETKKNTSVPSRRRSCPFVQVLK